MVIASPLCHCERSEAIPLLPLNIYEIASSLTFLAMTIVEPAFPTCSTTIQVRWGEAKASRYTATENNRKDEIERI